MLPWAGKNTKSRSLAVLLAFVFIGLGVALFIGSGTFTSTSTPTPPQENIVVTQEREPLPLHIRISDVIDLPVEETQFGPKGWQISETAASIASTSARPGESGNIVMYSHNKKHLFGKLSLVKKDDQITISTQKDKEFTYRVTDRVVVTPDQIDLLRPTQEEVLTLYTCTGFLDSKRLVVRAVPITE